MKKLDPRRAPLAHERIPVPLIYEQGKPVYVLDKGSSVKTGKDAVWENISVANLVVSVFETLFGPRRMIKVLAFPEGRYEVIHMTTDLLTILKRLKLEHPVAQMITGASIATRKEVGDGSVMTLILTGRILHECMKLISMGVHQNTVLDGLILSLRKILEVLEDRTFSTSLATEELVRTGVQSSLKGRLPRRDAGYLADIACRAVKVLGIERLANKTQQEVVDFKRICGGAVTDSFLVDGIALYGRLPSMDMPKKIHDAKVVLVKEELRIPKKLSRYWDYKYEFNTVEEFRGFEESKKKFLTKRFETMVQCGADLVLVEKGVDDYVIERFARMGKMLLMGFPPQVVERLAKATGAFPIPSLDVISSSDIGYAEVVEELTIGNEPWILIRGCRRPETIDIVLRGSVKYGVDDVERNLRAALSLAGTLARDPRVVWGGGASEEEIAQELRRYALELDDKKQLVVHAVSDAFEAIPITLAKSAGLNALDALIELRARHADGNASYGVDVMGKRLMDMKEVGVFDSLIVKKHVIRAAFETAVTIMRIDQNIRCRELSEPEKHYVKRMEGTSLKTLKKEHSDLEVVK